MDHHHHHHQREKVVIIIIVNIIFVQHVQIDVIKNKDPNHWDIKKVRQTQHYQEIVMQCIVTVVQIEYLHQKIKKNMNVFVLIKNI